LEPVGWPLERAPTLTLSRPQVGPARLASCDCGTRAGPGSVRGREGRGSSSRSSSLFEHDLFPKTGSHFSGSCSNLASPGRDETAPIAKMRKGRRPRRPPAPTNLRSDRLYVGG